MNKIFKRLLPICYAYGVCLLFTVNFNILEWSHNAKLGFLFLVFCWWNIEE